MLQKNFAVNFGRSMFKKGGQKDAVDYMIKCDQIRCTDAQVKNRDLFLLAVNDFVKYCKSVGKFFFTTVWGHREMSGTELKDILDKLMEMDRVYSPADRLSALTSEESFPFHLSGDFQDLWKTIVVLTHDHSGSTWSHKLFSVVDSQERADLAVQMYPDK